jgi:hypothetical protein
VSILFFALLGCTTEECSDSTLSTDCSDAFLATRLTVILGHESTEPVKEATEPTLDYDPLLYIEDSLTVDGEESQRSGWGIDFSDNELLVSIPTEGSIRSADIRDVERLQDAEPFLQGESLYSFGADIAIVEAPTSERLLLVGAPDSNRDSSSRKEGAVYLFQGEEERFHLLGESSGDNIGEAITACPDLDGDGWADWVISNSYATPDDGKPLAGTVHLGLSESWRYYAGSQGIESLPKVVGKSYGGRLGYSISCDDDIDGDDSPDILIGAPFADADADANGAVYILPSSMLGMPSIDASDLQTLYGLEENAWLGWDIGSGDMDGDGLAEIISGAPGALKARGEAHIWMGEELLKESRPNVRFRIRGERTGDSFGFTTLSTDFNGDGYADAVIGAPNHYEELSEQQETVASGKMYVFLGAHNFQGWAPSVSARLDADFTYSGQTSFLKVGQRILTNDFNADGAMDLVLLQKIPPRD